MSSQTTPCGIRCPFHAYGARICCKAYAMPMIVAPRPRDAHGRADDGQEGAHGGREQAVSKIVVSIPVDGIFIRSESMRTCCATLTHIEEGVRRMVDCMLARRNNNNSGTPNDSSDSHSASYRNSDDISDRNSHDISNCNSDDISNCNSHDISKYRVCVKFCPESCVNMHDAPFCTCCSTAAPHEPPGLDMNDWMNMMLRAMIMP